MESKNDTINFVKAVESQSGKYVLVTFVHFMDEKKEYLKWIVPVQGNEKDGKPYIYGTLIELKSVAKPAPKKEEKPAELEQDPLPF